jgi:hypothetical protein
VEMEKLTLVKNATMEIRIAEMAVHPIAIGNLDLAEMELFKKRSEKNVSLRVYMEKME